MVVAPFTSQGEERPVSSILDRRRPAASKGVGWLAPHRDTFLTELGKLGYAAKTIHHYQRAIDKLCAQVEARGLDAEEIGSELRAGQERKGYIARFIEYLIDAGVMAPQPPSPAAPPAPGSRDELSLARISQCAVERRVIPVGANPTQPLSLRLEATRAAYGGNEVGPVARHGSRAAAGSGERGPKPGGAGWQAGAPPPAMR